MIKEDRGRLWSAASTCFLPTENPFCTFGPHFISLLHKHTQNTPIISSSTSGKGGEGGGRVSPEEGEACECVHVYMYTCSEIKKKLNPVLLSTGCF